MSTIEQHPTMTPSTVSIVRDLRRHRFCLHSRRMSLNRMAGTFRLFERNRQIGPESSGTIWFGSAAAFTGSITVVGVASVDGLIADVLVASPLAVALFVVVLSAASPTVLPLAISPPD